VIDQVIDQVIDRIGSGYPNWLHFELRHDGAAVDPLLVLEASPHDVVRVAELRCRG
jgi:hypothetical protein